MTIPSDELTRNQKLDPDRDPLSRILGGSFRVTPDGFTAARLGWWRWLLPLSWLLVGAGVGLDQGSAILAASLWIVTLPLLLVIWLPALMGRIAVSASGIDVRSIGTRQWRWDQLQPPVITGAGIRTTVRLRSADGRHLGRLSAVEWGWAPLHELARRSHAVTAEANTPAQRQALEAQFPGSLGWHEKHPRLNGLFCGVVTVLGFVVVIVATVWLSTLLE